MGSIKKIFLIFSLVAISFIALLAIQTTAQAQSSYCTYEAVSGTRTIDYNDYYMELFKAYTKNKNEKSSFVRDLNIQFANSLFNACPEFYQRLKNDELPVEGSSTGNNLMDLLKKEIVKRNDTFKQLRQEHPKMKRWLNSID